MPTEKDVWDLARVAEGQQLLIDDLLTVAGHFLAGEKMVVEPNKVAGWLSMASALRIKIKEVKERVGDQDMVEAMRKVPKGKTPIILFTDDESDGVPCTKDPSHGAMSRQGNGVLFCGKCGEQRLPIPGR
jgi:hypothetical protein